MERRHKILGDIRFDSSLGIEIGALHLPLIPRFLGPVIYVDYASAETLRAKFLHDANAADIVETDIIWGDRPLLECVGRTVDYVVASHVIEHVPDLIGWLLELHAVLRPGGLVCLAVPDCRATFDVRRLVSLPGEMVEAYLLRYRRPSLRQVFDSAALSKNSSEPEDWRAGEITGGLPAEVCSRLVPARDIALGLSRNPSYVDAHCWVFTPSSFLDTAEALAIMGYFPYVIVAFYQTEQGDIEFFVRLQAVTDPHDSKVAASIAACRANLLCGAAMPGLEVSVPVVEGGHPAVQMLDLERENTRLRAEIDIIRGSHSWRLTAPLRAAMRLVMPRR